LRPYNFKGPKEAKFEQKTVGKFRWRWHEKTDEEGYVQYETTTRLERDKRKQEEHPQERAVEWFQALFEYVPAQHSQQQRTQKAKETSPKAHYSGNNQQSPLLPGQAVQRQLPQLPRQRLQPKNTHL